MEDVVQLKDPDLERQSSLDALQIGLGRRFRDPALLLEALLHRSFTNQYRRCLYGDRELEDNQRLEFLGDAVLGLAVSALLYERYPDLKEGTLSKLRAGLVNEDQLAVIAVKIGAPPALFLGRGEESTGGREKKSILADAVEALIAAVFLDGGWEGAAETVLKLWGPLVDRSDVQDLLRDYKTGLQELTQARFGLTPEYRLLGSQGPDHAREFEAAVYLGGEETAVGRGRSKKGAEQEAAKAAHLILAARGPDES